MAVSLLCSFSLSAVISKIAAKTQMHIWWNYVDEEAYFRAVEKEGSYYVADIPRPNAGEMTRSDYFVSELCDFLQTYNNFAKTIKSIHDVFLVCFRTSHRKFPLSPTWGVALFTGTF